jgi:hypothetical protein
MRSSAQLAAAVLLLALPAIPVEAWIITQVEPLSGANLVEAQTVWFGREGSTDRYEIDKYYLSGFSPGTTYVILKFTREPNDAGVIRVDLVDELILNLTGDSWVDYHVALLSDPVGEFLGDVDAVRFNDPNKATAWQQTGGASRLGNVPVAAGDSQIDWVTADGNQSVPRGTFADQPANQLVLRGLSVDVSNLESGDWFALKQWPTIPEPATAALVALGWVAMVIRRRRGARSEGSA